MGEKQSFGRVVSQKFNQLVCRGVVGLGDPAAAVMDQDGVRVYPGRDGRIRFGISAEENF